MKRAFFSYLLALGLTACGGNFSPMVDESTGDTGATTGMMGGTGSGTGTDTDGGIDTEDGTGTATDDGTGTSGLDMGSSDTGTDTGEPMDNPGPDEICDPFLALDGTAPCDGDPEEPGAQFTCVPVQTEPLPDQFQYDFRCRKMFDNQSDGYELGDPCSDSGGYEFAGCMNLSCTSNGLGNDPNNDVYANHPPGACPFQEEDGPYIRGCCTPYCDGDNPCEPGWFCHMNFAPIDGIGACIWIG